MRSHNRKTAVRVYNQLRFSLTIGSPAFFAAGVLALLGFTQTRVSGEPVDGGGRIAAGLVFLVIAVVLGTLRVTIFRHPPELE